MTQISASGSARQNRELAVGEDAPDFSLTDPMTGTSVRLSERRGQDVLLVFFRGTWCPYCREQMALLKDNQERLWAARIAVIGVISQSAGGVKNYLTGNPLPFPLLPDENRVVARAYGTHYWLTYEGFNLSHPALFILDPQGKITFAHVGRNMSDLPLPLVLERFLSFLTQTDDSKKEI